MFKIDAHSHVGEGAAVWTGKQVVDRMDTIGVDKTVIFPLRRANGTTTSS